MNKVISAYWRVRCVDGHRRRVRRVTAAFGIQLERTYLLQAPPIRVLAGQLDVDEQKLVDSGGRQAE